jgi:excinuclease ABC subunit A
VQAGMKHGQGIIMILDNETGVCKYFSRHLMCPSTGISYNEPAPHNFSFNSPQGACPKCNGLGMIPQLDMDKIIPDRSISIFKGGITPLGPYRNSMIFWQIESIAESYGFDLKTPIAEIPEEALDKILFGTGERIQIKNSPLGENINYFMTYEGIVNI